VMVVVLEGSAAPHGDQPGVSFLAENHWSVPYPAPNCAGV
jgi:hypothetical protein